MALTEAKIQTHVGDLIRIMDEFRRYAHVNAENFIAHELTVGNNLDGDFQYGANSTAKLGQFRQALDAVIRRGPDLLVPSLWEYGQFLNFPERDVPTILRRLREDFAAGAKTVLSRNFTFGTPAAIGSKGTINRLNLDEDGEPIDAQTPDAKIAECIRDEHTGAAEHEEVFEFRSNSIPEKDALKLTGSGRKQEIKALSAVDSLGMILNPSFSAFQGPLAVPTEISNWTVDNSIANFEVVETASNVYRDAANDATPRSVLFKAADTLSQNLNVRRAQVDPDIPMYFQIAWKRGTATAGTLLIRLGSQTESVAVVAQSGWQVLRLAVGVKNWFKTWNLENPFVDIDLSGSNGTIWVDDIILAPFTRFDGAWYAVVGNATPFLRGDSSTWSDSVGTEGLIQHWLWRLFNTYLPSHPTTPTWADPT